MTTEDLHDRLDQLAASADAPGRIDIAKARRGGRRTLRSRRAAKVIGSAAAVGLATAAAVALPNLGSSARHDSTTASSLPIPQGHSPIQRAVFGWLPAGHTDPGMSDVNGDYNASVSFMSTTGELIGLTAFAPGAEPPLGFLRGGIPAKRIPAAAVNGHPAYWIEKPGAAAQEAQLRWQYGPRSWAELEVDGPTSSADVYRIASTAKFSDTRKLALPFRFPATPGGLTLQHVTIGPPQPQGVADVDAKYEGDVQFQGKEGYVDVYFQPDSPKPLRDPGAGAPNTTVDGHPAFHGIGTTRSKDPKAKGLEFGTELLCVYKVKGLDICVEASPAKILTATGGVTGFYHRLQILGSNPADWTTS